MQRLEHDNSARVLVVEDEPIVAFELAERLKRLGYEVTGAVPSGEEALERFAADRPDIVLLDVRLQGELDGVQVAAKLKDRGTPIVFLTAYSDDTTLAAITQTDPDGYILKPFDDRVLRVTIESALARRRAERERRRAVRVWSWWC